MIKQREKRKEASKGHPRIRSRTWPKNADDDPEVASQAIAEYCKKYRRTQTIRW